MPNIEELRAFYEQNKENVDLIVRNAIENNPEMRQLKQRALFEEQMAAFHKAFPESGLSAPEDFLKMEQAEDFLRYIEKGLSIVEAYKLCAFDNLMEHAQGKGKKEGLMQATSKSHLKSTGSGMAKSGSTVPAEVKEIYKVLLSDWDESKMQKHYNRR